MFILRLLFWLTIAVLLLPTDDKSRHAVQAAAMAGAHDIATFCDRHEDVCMSREEAVAVVKAKLAYGYVLVTDIAASVSESLAERPDANSPGA